MVLLADRMKNCKRLHITYLKADHFKIFNFVFKTKLLSGLRRMLLFQLNVIQ